MPRVLIPLAEGCEELEAVTLIDLLRRAGITVVTASLSQPHIKASRGTNLVADTTLEQVLSQQFDMIILPGGQPGTTHLDEDARIHSLLKSFHLADKYLAAICAAPLVLAKSGLLEGRQATAYPDTLRAEHWPNIDISNEAIVQDGKILTSRGPGTAMDFALKLIEVLINEDTRKEVEAGLVRP